jgi:thymidylate kinase
LPKKFVKRVAVEAKSGLRMANQLAEEWFRQSVVWYYLRRGNIVLFDRHFLLDYYFYDVKPSGERPIGNQVHGFVLNHFYPRPDLVICLDAPAEVLFARKGEGTLESIERRRQEYLQLDTLVEKFVVVDATQPEAKVLQDVSGIIEAFYITRMNQANQGAVKANG